VLVRPSGKIPIGNFLCTAKSPSARRNKPVTV
jgi:hypothetical protein